MSVTAKWFGNGLLGQYSATSARRVDWVGDTVKVMLTTSTYTPNQDTHDFKDDVTNEVSSTGYTAGGASLASKAATYDAASNTVRLDADDVTWSSVTFTARYAVIYKDTGTAATSPLLGWVDFGADQSPAGVNFTISWDATDGVLRVVVA